MSEIEGLIARLRRTRRRHDLERFLDDEVRELVNPDGPAAATALEQQKAEIEKLKEGLRAFAEVANELDRIAGSHADYWDDSTLYTAEFTVGDLRKARRIVGSEVAG